MEVAREGLHGSGSVVSAEVASCEGFQVGQSVNYLVDLDRGTGVVTSIKAEKDRGICVQFPGKKRAWFSSKSLTKV